MNREAVVALEPLYFNFHDLVTVEVAAAEPEDRAFFAAEYNHHRSDSASLGRPGVVLRVRRGLDRPGTPRGYTFHQHKLLARWGYTMQIGPERIELDVVGNRLAIPMVHHMLLHPSLRYLSAQQGVLLLHAGAVSHLGKSLIFTGYGGAGKTTTTALLLAGGGADWSPHGDDYIFLGPGPASLAYMTRSHLYSDLLKWVPEVRGRLSAGERPRLELFSLIRRWSGDRLKWAVRLPIERLWPGREMAKSATPAAVILLGREPSAHRPSLHAVEVNDALVGELIRMNFYEARHFLNLVQKSGSVPDFASWLEDWQSCEQALLQARLREVPIYRLALPGEAGSPAAFRGALVDELRRLVELAE
jgi:hypothetical protein